LAQRGIRHVVLERGPDVAHSWTNFYDSLTLHTGKHMSALPGLRFPRGTPLFPPRDAFVSYLQTYRRVFALPVRTGEDVRAVARDAAAGAWVLSATSGEIRARRIVVATGIAANPHVPMIRGRDRFAGRVVHSVEYRRPAPFAGRRVMVVGAGNSAGEIAAELAGAGASVTVAVRSGRHIVPRDVLGVPIQYLARATASLPRSAQRRLTAAVSRVGALRHGPPVLPAPSESACPDVPIIGFHLADAIRAGTVSMAPDVVELTAGGAKFADGTAAEFDDVLLATGFRAAIGALAGLIRTDACGFAMRHGRVASADHPGLYFVGHNYDTRGAILNIAHDARLAARLIAQS
jgi:cation diffusion facilitator CzcD-associated flavoprotein CzcO